MNGERDHKTQLISARNKAHKSARAEKRKTTKMERYGETSGPDVLRKMSGRPLSTETLNSGSRILRTSGIAGPDVRYRLVFDSKFFSFGPFLHNSHKIH